jgi:hypothetical protein
MIIPQESFLKYRSLIWNSSGVFISFVVFPEKLKRLDFSLIRYPELSLVK